jgi:hypothetical protein
MTANLLLSDLATFGWRPAAVDICWLDCNQPGYLKQHVERDGSERVIVLCISHLSILEAGVFMEDYSGAPLPRDSRAGSWPWRPKEEVAGERWFVQSSGPH